MPCALKSYRTLREVALGVPPHRRHFSRFYSRIDRTRADPPLNSDRSLPVDTKKRHDYLVPLRTTLISGHGRAVPCPFSKQEKEVNAGNHGKRRDGDLKIIKNATLKVYQGAPHGMCTTMKDQVNADLFGFLERKEQRKAA